ncbi:mannose-1-phosphate guanylyltransferase/mannose-6-phosphate isomerase [Ottowia sp.]|uniref:mannose-1-phosphate guanylyltransferase/mannose-6-phosphate isomerase n=1 Tax=Ottowia sp. TaxID=1898956 RepID=UPI002619C6A3|nr:mannose-1-phosphate guanylyltransferase/mannose-6-phosphate isomerase [Ottowia sp.]
MSILQPVVLSGGSGTRLWPLSRESYPKQFLSFSGDGRSMLQHTVQRLEGLGGQPTVAGPLVVCNAEHRFIVAQQLSELGLAHPRIVLEPAGRNTAPALTLAALAARSAQTPDAESPVLLVMPADHVIADVPAFHGAVAAGWQAARAGAMVVFGVVADRPETGYGYIRQGPQRPDGSFDVLGFTEKPDAERARRYLEAGDYLWNSGLFAVRADVWLQAIGRYRPDILAACEAAMGGALQDVDFIRPDTAAFEACPSDSIDYAVMERLPSDAAAGVPAALVPLAAGWSDLGAWDAVWGVQPKDAAGNAAVGPAVSMDSRNTLLFSSGRLVAGLGLDDLVVVETPDAVLVARQDRLQEVKQLVALLRDRGDTLAGAHRKVHRPWGWYDEIDAGERFKVKRIVVNPGASISLQKHHHRAEHWVVVRGTAHVTQGDEVRLLGENESTFIPLGHVHRLANPGKLPLEVIEVQSGSYLEEDDIVRYEDTYGRERDG